MLVDFFLEGSDKYLCKKIFLRFTMIKFQCYYHATTILTICGEIRYPSLPISSLVYDQTYPKHFVKH